MKLIALHHRLGSFGGHRYNEGLGLIEESERRGWELDLLVPEQIPADVLAHLVPYARPVFNDPTFDLSRTFEQRVDEFVRQVREYAQPALTSDARVLVTVATQCEACALARWARDLPPDRMPSFYVMFLSDRWNRAGARSDEPAELATAGRELASLPPAVRDRFTLFASTPELAGELSLRLGANVSPLPAHLNYRGLGEIARERAARPPPRVPVLGFIGGLRREKGSHLVPDIVAACRTRANVRFVVQSFDEGLDAAALAGLRALAAADDVTLIERQLDRTAYEHVLRDIDLLMCPYERVNYRQRNSGIFSEGVAAGLPAVVPSGTWMAARIAEGRAAGVVYEGTGPEAVAEAVARCARDIGAYTQSAAAVAASWRTSESLGAALDAMEHLARRAARQQGAT